MLNILPLNNFNRVRMQNLYLDRNAVMGKVKWVVSTGHKFAGQFRQEQTEIHFMANLMRNNFNLNFESD
jgi:hypothetical protein